MTTRLPPIAEDQQEDEDEDALVQRARARDAEAFSRLVWRHQSRVRVYIAYHMHRFDLVEDIAQDVFLSAYRRLDTYRGEVPLSRWLIGIARTRVLECLRNELRRQARNGRAFEASLLESRALLVESEQAGGALDARTRELAALEACIGKLPARSAELVNQHYFRAKSLVDIAQEHGRKEGAIRMTFLRIRQALRDCVERQVAEGVR